MAVYTIIKLKGLSPLHMGTGKENYDFSASCLHSDTISSALTSMKARYEDSSKLEDFIDSFTVSSAFPYVGDLFFLPRPLGNINVTVSDCDEYVSRKKLKAVRYIEQGLWNDLIVGKHLSITSEQLKGGFLLPKTNSFKLPCKSVVSQRVTVPREDGEDAEPFFFDWTFFEKDAGLFCMTDAKDNKLEELLRLFEILGETGIGTDKNVGGGKFNVEASQVSIPDVSDSEKGMLLSLYIPTEEEISSLIDLDNSRFELSVRGGYMAGSNEYELWHLRKKSVYMLNVGSVLKYRDKLFGKVVDLCPTDYNDSRLHPVYRSGKPFIVPIK